MTALNHLTASDAAAGIRSGSITSEALVEACLARIAEREGAVKAFAHIDPAHALGQARAADAQQRAGHAHGALHGVPVAIKDIIDTADMPTENGSPAHKGRQPERDAACVTALRAAGAVILGKTITTELATLTPNITHNPVNLAHTPGGSSSGSAAAVADCMVPAALATQTGGSIIRPASFCGIYGFKPTFGTIPRTGVLAQALSLDTVGVYGRSVEDLALLADVMSAHDPADRGSYRRSGSGLAALAAGAPPITPMFAFVKSAAWHDPGEPAMREAFGELGETLGGQLAEESIDHTIERGLALAKIVNNAELAAHFGPILDRARDAISPRLTAQIVEGRTLKAADYVQALAAREEIYRSLQSMFDNYGTILTPAAPGPAPKGLGATGNPIFNAFWTFMGVPCVTLPLLQIDGMPMGVQLVAARRDDGRLLRTARWLVGHLAHEA